MRIGLDLRWLEQAYRNSPIGAIGGIGTFSRNLWLGLARVFPEIELVALVSRGVMPEPFLNLIRMAPRHQIQSIGLSGLWLIPSLEHRGNYTALLRLLEGELFTAARLNRLKLDVLHMLDQTPPPRGLSVPSVVTVHAQVTELLRITCSTRGTIKSLIANLLRRKLLMKIERANLLVSVSHSLRCDVAQCFPQRVERLAVIPNGVDLDIFKPRTEPGDRLMRRFSIHGDYFIHVGILTDVKNPWGLIRAMKRVVEKTRQKIVLVNVGPYQVNPTLRDRVVALAHECGIENRVLVVDRGVGPEDMAALLRHSIGLVFPSFVEGFGYPAMETLACGVPCVVARTGALPEVVGDLGILVDPHSDKEIADGMLRLLNDEPYRAKIREQGPVWAQRFSFEAMAKKYMELYQSLA